MDQTTKYIRRKEISELAAKHGIGEWTVKLIFGKESRARKMLPNRSRPVYVRCIVLELLGLPEEKP